MITNQIKWAAIKIDGRNSNSTRISLTCISNALNGKSKTAGGYIWEKCISYT